MPAENGTVRTVEVQGREISYTFCRKAVKNINLRLRRDGSITVSAPPRVPTAYVDDFVRAKGAILLRGLEALSGERKEPPPRQYVTGETVWYLGLPLGLEIRAGSRPGGEIEGRTLALTVPEGADPARRERVFLRFWDESCRRVFGEILDRQYPLFAPMGVAVPELRVRGMRSRWGSCHCRKGTITLSRQLLERPMPAVEYVVLHEYCHFIHPNHSPDFYALVSALMPDWRERKKLLSAPLPDLPAPVQQQGQCQKVGAAAGGQVPGDTGVVQTL